MKLIASIIIAASVTIGSSALAQEAEAIDKAKAAAGFWLALVDSGDYAQSWEQSAAPFQAGIGKATWTGMVGSMRAPDGSWRVSGYFIK